MELQNQIYLLIAVFGGVCTLLLVFIAILAIYVINIKKSVIVKDSERKYENYGFEHDATVHNITDDLRSMKSEATRRPPQKSNLSKPRNDDSNHNNGRRKEKVPNGGGGRDGRKRQYSESGDTSGRDFDSAFDNEINNMFDIDDDDDQESVVSDKNERYHRQSRHQGPPPPPTSGGMATSGNRNRNFNPSGNGNRHDINHQMQMNRPGGGNGYQGSVYPSGSPHEGKTYFNGRGMKY